MAKRKQVKNACVNCQKACKKCDDGRPCTRCVKYGIADTCTNSSRKERKRGIKRGSYVRSAGLKRKDAEHTPALTTFSYTDESLPFSIPSHQSVTPTFASDLPDHPTRNTRQHRSSDDSEASPTKTITKIEPVYDDNFEHLPHHPTHSYNEHTVLFNIVHARIKGDGMQGSELAELDQLAALCSEVIEKGEVDMLSQEEVSRPEFVPMNYPPFLYPFSYAVQYVDPTFRAQNNITPSPPLKGGTIISRDLQTPPETPPLMKQPNHASIMPFGPFRGHHHLGAESLFSLPSY